MTHRSFTDSTGRRWTVWRVMPLAAERRQHRRRLEIEGLDGERDGLEPRSGSDRRLDESRLGEPDRRSGIERRILPGRRSELDRRTGVDRRAAPRARVALPGSFSAGWLCFESQGEKRRLTPVPAEWELANDDALLEWLDRAVGAAIRRPDSARATT
jgi:hypothetical protein